MGRPSTREIPRCLSQKGDSKATRVGPWFVRLYVEALRTRGKSRACRTRRASLILEGPGLLGSPVGVGAAARNARKAPGPWFIRGRVGRGALGPVRMDGEITHRDHTCDHTMSPDKLLRSASLHSLWLLCLANGQHLRWLFHGHILKEATSWVNTSH